MPVQFYAEAQGLVRMINGYKATLVERYLVFGEHALTRREMDLVHKSCHAEMVDPRIMARAEAKRYEVWKDEHPYTALMYVVVNAIREVALRNLKGVAVGVLCIALSFYPHSAKSFG